MRRRTLRALFNPLLFVSALLIIFYLNRQQSSDNAFAWTTIRYRTTSSTLPKTRGVCPGLADSTKPALVVARVTDDGDTKWLDKLATLYHLCVYTADAPLDTTSTHLQVPANRGHEAMAYLTFMIDNYEHIPAAGAVFVHGSRWAWHNDEPEYDNAILLSTLNVSAALSPQGYHNMRCDWSAGTCSPREAQPQGSLETSMRAIVEPWNTRAASDAALPRALAALFGGDSSDARVQKGTASDRLSLGRTNAVRAQCCAQFVVSRERIWQHSREEYIALRQWLLDDGDSSAPADDRISGRILSYVWHILFLQPEKGSGINLDQLNTLACPRAEECYCRLYGRCKLDDCRPGSCYGQYTLPQDYRLPADWAAKHS